MVQAIDVPALEQISKLLRDPRLRDIPETSPELLARHQQILREKPLLNQVFREFYHVIRKQDLEFFHGEGTRLEVGAGSGFMKEVYPDVVISDVKSAPHIERIIDAEQLPFRAASLRAIYGINCFHHFPDVRKFFRELERCLIPGGGAILIEPYYGWLARKLYRNLHRSETFLAEQSDWTGMDPTNQALSFIVFVRDRERFHREFPGLEIVENRLLNNYWRYLFSGGVNFRQLVPDFLIPAVRALEFLCYPFRHFFALHHSIVLRKRPGDGR